MLKMTNVQLELMTDIDMFQFIEKGMRGGISYIGLCNAIPKHRRKVLRRDNENDLVVSDESVQPFKNSPPTCRQARPFYVSKSFHKPTSEVRLVEAGFTDQTIAALYVLPFKLTKKHIKFSMFQFKINHQILNTRDKLFKAKITDSDSCHVCELKQTVEHLFVECQYVHSFWNLFTSWWNDNSPSVSLINNNKFTDISLRIDPSIRLIIV